MKTHPAAELFPMMDVVRFDELVASIRDHGLRVPIVLYEGMILDGRNRFKACATAGVEPHFTEFRGDDAVEYVWDLNGERRDLTAVQRLAIRSSLDDLHARMAGTRDHANRARSDAAKAQPRKDGGFGPGAVSRDTAPGPSGELQDHRTRMALAARANVSEATAARVQAVIMKRPDMLPALRDGSLGLTEAMRQVKRDEIAKNVAPLPDGTYRVIYADPPWQYYLAVERETGTPVWIFVLEIDSGALLTARLRDLRTWPCICTHCRHRRPNHCIAPIRRGRYWKRDEMRHLHTFTEPDLAELRQLAREAA